MARTMYISFVDPNTDNDDFLAFRNIESLHKGLMFVDNTLNAGAAAKAVGIDIPNRHGIYPVEHPVKESTETLDFVIRDIDSKAIAENEVYNFVTWIYSIGEFRVSFDEETYYRRAKYSDVSQLEFLNGRFGIDIRLQVTVVYIDSMVYNRDTPIQRFDSLSLNEESRILTVETNFVSNYLDTPLVLNIEYDSYINQTNSEGVRMMYVQVNDDVINFTANRAYGGAGQAQSTLTIDSNLLTATNKTTFGSNINEIDLTADINGSFPFLKYGLNKIKFVTGVSIGDANKPSYINFWLSYVGRRL